MSNTVASDETNLGVRTAARGDFQSADRLLCQALTTDPNSEAARLNLDFLRARGLSETCVTTIGRTPSATPDCQSTRVAILSFLFGWPSTGGGIVHTMELAQFLTKSGYHVCHFFARYPDWDIGSVQGTPPFPSEA